MRKMVSLKLSKEIKKRCFLCCHECLCPNLVTRQKKYFSNNVFYLANKTRLVTA